MATGKSIKAASVKVGQWLLFSNPRLNSRVVEVQDTRDGQIKVSTDFGNGGEPATSFFDANEDVLVSDLAAD